MERSAGPPPREDQRAYDVAAVRDLWLERGLTEPENRRLQELLARLIIGARNMLMKRPGGIA
jgi:hypothetical protein